MNTESITSDSALPFAISVVAATLIGLFPLHLGRRAAHLYFGTPSFDSVLSSSKNARYVAYIIFMAVICLHIAEAIKSALFGMYYFQSTSLSFLYLNLIKVLK